MLQVGGFIRGFYAILVKNRAKHLGPLQNHFHNMLVRVIAGTGFDVCIEYEDVHDFISIGQDQKESWSLQSNPTLRDRC